MLRTFMYVIFDYSVDTPPARATFDWDTGTKYKYNRAQRSGQYSLCDSQASADDLKSAMRCSIVVDAFYAGTSINELLRFAESTRHILTISLSRAL